MKMLSEMLMIIELLTKLFLVVFVVMMMIMIMIVMVMMMYDGDDNDDGSINVKYYINIISFLEF